jgi:hypothetical protein
MENEAEEGTFALPVQQAQKGVKKGKAVPVTGRGGL